MEIFLGETAKLTYLLFQRHFEDHENIVQRSESVIVYLLATVSNEWKTNSLVGQSSKKLIRKLIDIFPTAEPGIWRHFLLYFRRGVVPQAREMRDWLFPREKSEYAICLLCELGPITKALLDNA